MTNKITSAEVKVRLFSLLDEVAAGRVVEITHHGILVARLEPVGGQKPWRGVLKGIARTAATDEELFSTGAWTEQHPQ